jgi:hypothetical protein
VPIHRRTHVQFRVTEKEYISGDELIELVRFQGVLLLPQLSPFRNTSEKRKLWFDLPSRTGAPPRMYTQRTDLRPEVTSRTV